MRVMMHMNDPLAAFESQMINLEAYCDGNLAIFEPFAILKCQIINLGDYEERNYSNQ